VIEIMDWAFDLRGKKAEKYIFPLCQLTDIENTSGKSLVDTNDKR
jgi:hypothetical protein